MGDRDAPAVNLPVPDGGRPLSPQTRHPRSADGPIVGTGPEFENDPPNIIALMSRPKWGRRSAADHRLGAGEKLEDLPDEHARKRGRDQHPGRLPGLRTRRHLHPGRHNTFHRPEDRRDPGRRRACTCCSSTSTAPKQRVTTLAQPPTRSTATPRSADAVRRLASDVLFRRRVASSKPDTSSPMMSATGRISFIRRTICPTGIAHRRRIPLTHRWCASLTRTFCSGIGSGSGAPSASQASVQRLLSSRAGLPV